MVVSLLKVLHSGLQDERLQSIQPRLDLYMKVFRRAGRFASQWIRLDFNQIPQFGQTASIVIPRKGHLVARIYLVTTLPDITTPQLAAQKAAATTGANFAGPYFRWTNSIGHALVQEASVFIGGSKFDTLSARLLEIMDEFNTPLEKVPLVDSLIQREPNYQTTKLPPAINQVVTPLPFWFSRGDPSLWLPVDALSVDEVRADITFAPFQNLYYTDSHNEDPIGDAVPTVCKDGATFLLPMAASPFYKLDPKGKRLYNFSKVNSPNGLSVSKIPGAQMPGSYSLGDTYILAEYIYLDKPEANRFRVSQIQTPIVQHYALEPQDTQSMNNVKISLDFPNPIRDLYFYCQRPEAIAANCLFLATREISGLDQPYVPWWPNPDLDALYPGFADSNSEPIRSISVLYEGQRVRFKTENTALFRSILPSFEHKKAPFYNRYFYNIPFGFQNGLTAPSQPTGEANFSIIQNKDLILEIRPGLKGLNRFTVFVYGETYNVLTIYGGRGSLLFGY